MQDNDKIVNILALTKAPGDRVHVNSLPDSKM